MNAVLERIGPPARAHGPAAHSPRGRRAHATSTTSYAVAREVVIALAVYLAYRAGRLVTQDAATLARRNANLVIDTERSLGLFTETDLQAWALHSDLLIRLLNGFYVSAHFPVTIVFLIWVFVRHQHAYRNVRNWLTTVTMVGLAIHVAFPLAPPRMTPGFVDTLAAYGPRIYTDDPAASVANQYAAMPSLHFGWALIVAIGVRHLGNARRAIWLHPLITLVAIVVTANHYWLDALVAAVLVAGTAPRFLRSSDRPGRPHAHALAEPTRAPGSPQ